MIYDKVKEAWREFSHKEHHHEIYRQPMRDVINAYVEAEWQRRRWKFLFEHSVCVRAKCNDPRHNRTDADWQAELLKELESK